MRTPNSSELTVTKLNIKMPPALKRRGRPKNSEKTNVIGLPKKKGKVATLCRYVDMKNSEKEKQVFTWCVGETISKSCLTSREKVRSEMIDPTEISAAIYSELVNIQSIAYWFEEDAWTKFQTFYEAKSTSLINRCSSCSKNDTPLDELICCDHCLLKFHHSCGKVKQTSKKRHQWFCNPCKIEFKSTEQETSGELETEN